MTKQSLLLVLLFLSHSFVWAKTFDLTLEVESYNGKKEKLKETFESYSNDKPILIYLWASWCPDCHVEKPKLRKFVKDHGEKLNLLYLSVNKNRKGWLKNKKKESSPSIKSRRYAEGWTNKEFKKSISLDWIPRYIIVNKKGEILFDRAITVEDRKFREFFE